jgi:DNA-directed RNA polymerase subunit beta'
LSPDKKDILAIEDIAKDKNIISATLPAPVYNCYDIEVEHEDHLFVLDSGLITSNSTKRATAKGGDLAKQMVQSAANLVVSENDCGAANGIDLEVDDKSLRGRVLARDIGNVPAGTVLDKNALSNIRKQGFEKLIARSPMTCQAKEGVCARCMGLNALGKFPAKGDTVGITAAQAIGEPITQGALNVKHQGGAAGANQRYAGFAVINQFVQTPDTFPDKAVLSKIDGQVSSVIEAPQGGHYVTVDNEPHYVAPGYPVTVKVGERVEAGDTMSEGLPDPGEIVELRGLGEGRKYYANKLKQLLDDSGMEADRRNTELMSRAALDHLQITDVKEDDEYLPDDVVSYSYFSNRYTPPKDTSKYKVDKAVGTYLQSPALHYTIGTKITPKIATHLKSSGFEEVFTSPESPTFKPHMVRLRAATHHGDDWLASMHTSYLKKQLGDSAIRGEDSNVENNIHFAPRLAIGTNFGENIEQTGKF